MMFKIPLFKLNYGSSEKKAIIKALSSRWISTGPLAEKLEGQFRKALHCKFSVSLSSCTAALHLALKAAGIGRDDEVIVPSLTFVATVNAVRYVDALPVFCDIRSLNDLTIDPDKIRTLLTDKTRAIVVMHYAGFPCDMDPIISLARKHNLKVIEDASHAPFSEYRGKKLGTIGDIGVFSFFANKNISTAEGGMLVTNNGDFTRRIKLLRSHGMTSLSYERAKGHSSAYDVVELGYNYRFDDLRAALGLVQLGKLKGDLEKRNRIRRYYLKKLAGIKEVIVPFADYEGLVSNYIFPVVLKESDSRKRERFRDFLKEKGIQTSVHYPAVHRFAIYKNEKLSLPFTQYVSDNEVTLPMYSSLTRKEIDYIADMIKEFFRRGR
jgi:dTDP-4-amino-4,6-dideoxygalactose transaminase